MSVLGGASVSPSPSSALWGGQGLSLHRHSATGRGRIGTSAITPLRGTMTRAQGRPLNAQTIFEVTIPSTTNPAHHQGPRVPPDDRSRTCAQSVPPDLGSFSSNIQGTGMMVAEGKVDGADPKEEVEACTDGLRCPGSPDIRQSQEPLQKPFRWAKCSP